MPSEIAVLMAQNPRRALALMAVRFAREGAGAPRTFVTVPSAGARRLA